MSGQPKAEEQPSKQRRGKKKMGQAQKAQQQQQAVAHAPIEANALLTAVAGCAAGLPACCRGSLELQQSFQIPRQPRLGMAPTAAAALTPPLPVGCPALYHAVRWQARWPASLWALWTC